MKIHRYCRVLPAFIICLLLFVVLGTAPVFSQETEDSQMFLAGFNAYQQKNYAAAVSSLDQVLNKYPETPLRDMTLFWLARAHYSLGNRNEAARYMARFTREYPDSPLKNTVEEDLLALAAKQQAPDTVALSAQKQQEKAEAERLAAAKELEEQRVREKAAQEAAEKARILKAKAEADRLAREKAAAEQLAAAKAAEEKLAKERAEQEAAAEKARQLKAKAESDRIAREKAEAERLAVAKAEQDRLSKEQAAREAEERARTQKAEAERLAVARAEQNKKAAEQLKTERRALKDKAVSEYRHIVERFPGTPAARTAAARLKELGVSGVPAVTAPVVQQTEKAADTAQVLTLEVAQYAGLDFGVRTPAAPVGVADRQVIPFELVNQGNGQDSFLLTSGFPSDYGVRFAAQNNQNSTINQTPVLQPGERFNGIAVIQIPPAAIDGLRISYPLKAASQFNGTISQSRIVSMVAAAPLLRAVVKPDKLQLLPGEQVQYRITLLNVGSTAASDVSLRLNYPGQYQPVDAVKNGFKAEQAGILVIDGISLKSGESRDLTIDFQLKHEAVAHEELTVRADLLNNALQIKTAFLANTVAVLPVRGLDLRMAQQRVTVLPGQSVFVPAKITNRGNQREKFRLAVAGGQLKVVRLYLDLNRDGLLQHGEPEVAVVGPLAPKEEASLLLEVVAPASAKDGITERVIVSAQHENGAGSESSAELSVAYARPVLQLAMKGREGRMVPGELLTVELDVVNRGSHLARMVDLQVLWPEQMELVAADLPAVKAVNGSSVWQFSELGAGERRTVKASFRIKPGIGVGTGVHLKSSLTYQDQAGNRY